MQKDHEAEMGGAFVKGYCATVETLTKGSCLVFTRDEEMAKAGTAYLHFWQFEDGKPKSFGMTPLRAALAGLVGFCWEGEFISFSTATTCADQALKEAGVKEMRDAEKSP